MGILAEDSEFDKQLCDKLVWSNYEVDEKHVPKPKVKLYTTKEFTFENGLLTHTLKQKRHNIYEKYKEAIEEMLQFEDSDQVEESKQVDKEIIMMAP